MIFGRMGQVKLLSINGPSGRQEQSSFLPFYQFVEYEGFSFNRVYLITVLLFKFFQYMFFRSIVLLFNVLWLNVLCFNVLLFDVFWFSVRNFVQKFFRSLASDAICMEKSVRRQKSHLGLFPGANLPRKCLIDHSLAHSLSIFFTKMFSPDLLSVVTYVTSSQSVEFIFNIHSNVLI